ncbi:MAG: carboxypeptidase regulatory-like domain-containing protein [Acidobacteriaceae bacterium]|nr:carboxypeptidase regulatory-like domain-containing protein [Acidobacteriaceae bacterium]
MTASRLRAQLMLSFVCLGTIVPLLAQEHYGQFSVSGTVTDPQTHPVSGLRVLLFNSQGAAAGDVTTDEDGAFSFHVAVPGAYTLKVNVLGFEQVTQSVQVTDTTPAVADVRLGRLAEKQESITVTADVRDSTLLFPDPAQRVYVRQETLDANPGRPGAPISIPGLPIETASGGIKAPQYFSPGVAGDHGEPIAEYIQVGTYLVSNNLSANAHGNGYADPNIMVPSILEGVQTDGGAFNVREGNHAENLSAIYQMHSRLEPFVTVTGDYRDVDLAACWSPGAPGTDAWIAIEAAYGNGFLDRFEHRQQYKLNGFRVWNLGNHQLTLFGIGYFGSSKVPGLVPLDGPNLHDTIDPRQEDQTHTGLVAVNDLWKLSSTQTFQLSGMFRTYNLALYSNFGDGLIRQSEFRTVAAGNVTYSNDLAKYVSLMVGIDYQRDAPRRLDLDHYESTEPSYYGPFQKVTANNVTLGDAAPYIALNGTLPYDFHYYLGWRRDEIQFDNQDLLNPLNSYHTLVGFNNPKATIAFLPEQHPALPTVAFSFGEAFYTNDPRIGTGTERGTPISREHSYQLVISKTIQKTDLRVTLGHVTTEASLAKIDPDTGLQEDEGPGRNNFITLAARRYFGWGLLQASFSKADARDLDSGLPTPEAPRLILDALVTVNRLPFGLEARGEFEEVGAKPLGDGFTSVPVREFRGALLRSFPQHRMDLGLNFLIASGYTGQTTEVLAVDGQSNPFEQVTGVRLPSYVSVSYTYHFRP